MTKRRIKLAEENAPVCRQNQGRKTVIKEG